MDINKSKANFWHGFPTFLHFNKSEKDKLEWVTIDFLQKINRAKSGVGSS